MLNKLLTFIVIIELILLLLVNNNNSSNEYKYSINAYRFSNLDEAKLENYVIGVVAAEMPATFSIESLKAQAVAARTFAYKKIISSKLNYDNLTSDTGQAYISVDKMKKNWGDKFDSYYNKISDAVLKTKGEIITFNGEIINAYYFSLSNGITEDSSMVFGEAKYLVSVESPWDKENSNYINFVKIPINDFKKKLSINDEINISDIKRSASNHVNTITINNKVYDGVKFRKIFNLKSTDFNIEIGNEFITIETKGHGHGVGMSQYGANSMALSGKNYEKIIKYYYKDVEISKI